MRRRDFIKSAWRSGAGWPMVRGAASRTRMRRIGVLMDIAQDDPQLDHLAPSLSCEVCSNRAGIDGRNVHIEYSLGAGNPTSTKICARIDRARPDVVLALSGPTWTALQAATRTVPIVFAGTSRSGQRRLISGQHGTTRRQYHGFIEFESSIAGKRLELLKEIAPTAESQSGGRPGSDASCVGGVMLTAIQTMAPSFGVEVNPVDARNATRDRAHHHEFAAAPMAV